MFFPDEPKVGVKTIKQYAQMMKDENVNRAILVVQVNLTPHARQSLVEVQSRFLLEQVRRAITPTSLSPCPVTCFSGGAAPPRNPSPVYAATVQGESITSSEGCRSREYCVPGRCCLARAP